MLFLCNIANVTQKTFKIIQKSRSCKHGNIIISKKRTSTACASPETSTCEVPRDISRKLQLNVCDNGVVEVSLLHVLW